MEDSVSLDKFNKFANRNDIMKRINLLKSRSLKPLERMNTETQQRSYAESMVSPKLHYIDGKRTIQGWNQTS